MIRSLVKIEFIPLSGAAITLLDYGDRMKDLPQFPWTQQDFSATAAGSAWAAGIGMGGSSFAPSWSRYHTHATNQAAEAFRFSHASSMPIGVGGKLRVSIQGGNVYDYKHARILAVSTAQLVSKKPATTVTEYRATCGEMSVYSTATYTPPEDDPGSPPELVPEVSEETPGSPPELVPEVSEETPGTPPFVGPPGGAPRLIGVTLSGITYPTWANGFLPMIIPAIYPYPQFRKITGSDIVWILRSWSGGEWELGTNETGGVLAVDPQPENVWDVTSWMNWEFVTLTGTPVITPVFV